MEDTIAAIVTAPGISGVGIIRISGSLAADIADKVFKGKKGIPLRQRPTYTITYGHIYDENRQLLDEALALTMWGPHSFTGEDVVELQCHGGSVVLRRILELVLANGARLAEPGEFSKRAFLNGRLDLSQAESIMELITAKTEKGVQAAAINLEGGISRIVKELRNMIIDLIAYLEADIDFPEEDFERLEPEQYLIRLEEIEKKLVEVLGSYQSGKIIRDGLKTALIGQPNVGKSSLLNALLQERRAIVTNIPGTTRDVIQEYYNLEGIPLVLYDTAGLRNTEDEVEKIGVAMTWEVISEADLVIYVIDSYVGYSSVDQELLRELPPEKTIVILNKIDLLEDGAIEQDISELAGYEKVYVSAKEGLGLQDLTRAIKEKFLFQDQLEISEPVLTNVRHKNALLQSLEMVRSAKAGIEAGLDSDFISIDLRSAWETLGEVTGETLDDDIIDKIFSQFCLGK